MKQKHPSYLVWALCSFVIGAVVIGYAASSHKSHSSSASLQNAYDAYAYEGSSGSAGYWAEQGYSSSSYYDDDQGYSSSSYYDDYEGYSSSAYWLEMMGYNQEDDTGDYEDYYDEYEQYYQQYADTEDYSYNYEDYYKEYEDYYQYYQESQEGSYSSGDYDNYYEDDNQYEQYTQSSSAGYDDYYSDYQNVAGEGASSSGEYEENYAVAAEMYELDYILSYELPYMREHIENLLHVPDGLRTNEHMLSKFQGKKEGVQERIDTLVEKVEFMKQQAEQDVSLVHSVVDSVRTEEQDIWQEVELLVQDYYSELARVHSETLACEGRGGEMNADECEWSGVAEDAEYNVYTFNDIADEAWQVTESSVALEEYTNTHNDIEVAQASTSSEAYVVDIPTPDTTLHLSAPELPDNDTGASGQASDMEALKSANDALRNEIQHLKQQVTSLKQELQEIASVVESYNFGPDTTLEAERFMSETLPGLSRQEAEAQLGALIVKARDEKFTKGIIPFRDTDDYQWFTPYAKAAKDSGLVRGTGTSNGAEFNPTGTTNLAEAITTVTRVVGINEDAELTSALSTRFPTWTHTAVATLEQSGVDLEDMFANRQASYSITRGEMALLISEALDLPQVSTKYLQFADIHVASPRMKQAIANVRAAGIMKGQGQGTVFGVQGHLNRAEMATILVRVLESIGGNA